MSHWTSRSSLRLIASQSIACLALAIGLDGCASRPPAAPPVPADVQLAEHVTLVSGEVYRNVETARINVPACARPSEPGRLWISGTKGFTRRATSLEQIAQIDKGSAGSADASTRMQLRDGTWMDITNQYMLWCPASQSPDTSNNQCEKVGQLVGEEGTSLYRPHRMQWQPTGFDGLLTRHLGVYVGSAANQQRAMFTAKQDEAEQAAKQQQAERIQAEAEKRHSDELRVDRMRAASAGAKDFCTSRGLIARSTPIESYLSMNCGMLGEMTIGQLRDGGWDIQVTNRIPTQGSLGVVGDSVEITVTKVR